MVLLAVGLWAVETAALASRDANDQPLNVVLIVCDDLNDYVGPFGGHPQVITPHMDRLSEWGLVFSGALYDTYLQSFAGEFYDGNLSTYLAMFWF